MTIVEALKGKVRRTLGRSVIWNIEPSVMALHPDAMRLDRPDSLPEILAERFSDEPEAEINIAVEVGKPGTAVSYIPYLESGTSFIVHNFFAHNYAIRDPVLYRVVLVSNNRAIATRQFMLSPGATKLVEDAAAFMNPTGSEISNGILIISAHHPRIETPAGQLRFFGLYSSRRGFAGCHSMTASTREIPRGRIGYRAMAPESEIESGRMQTAALGTDFITLAKKTPITAYRPSPDTPAFSTAQVRESYYGIDGYFVIRDAYGACASIWHDGAFSHRLPPPPCPPGVAKTALGLPRFDEHAPVILIDGDQIGQDCASVEIVLVANDGTVLASRTLDGLPVPRCTVDLGDLFADERAGIRDATAVFDFRFDAKSAPKPPEMMLHAYYRNDDGLQDQSHTIRTIARATERNPGKVRTRTRKFCPLLEGGGRRTAFSLYNLAAYGELPEAEFTVRVFTDRDGETLSRITLPANGTGIFWASDFLPRDGQTRTGAIWLEHPSVNAAAHWFVFNDNGGSPATDHFTGG